MLKLVSGIWRTREVNSRSERDDEKLIRSNSETNKTVEDLSKKVSNLEKDLAQSEKKREKLEAQSRRENLKFYGLDDDKDETSQVKSNFMKRGRTLEG